MVPKTAGTHYDVTIGHAPTVDGVTLDQNATKVRVLWSYPIVGSLSR